MANETIRYFPFAEGLPYFIRNGRSVIPRMDADNWRKAFVGKTAVLSLEGGFIENIFTLSFFEALSQIIPGQKMEWCGDPFYKEACELQGLAKPTERISTEDLRRYPVPLFFNADKTAVFMNCLNNYREVYTYYGEFMYNDQRSLLQQIFRNLMIDWSQRYLPMFRKLEVPDRLHKFAKTSGFNMKAPYVLLMPDDTGLSNHDEKCLNWSLNDIRSFAAMLCNSNYNLVILSPSPQKYYGIRAFVPACNLENILYLMLGAKILLSREIDFVLASLLIGNIKAFSLRTNNEFKIEKNKKFICAEQESFIFDKLAPINVYEGL